MTKEFELKMPSETVVFYAKECDYLDSFENEMRFANLCATWGANQEYQESYNFIDDAWGSDHARVYQENRRPKILTMKEQAIKAFEHILSHSESQLGMETVLKALQSLPDEDT